MSEHTPTNKEPRMAPQPARQPFLDWLVNAAADFAAWWIRRGGWRGRKGTG